MTDEKIDFWIDATVSDLFSRFFYYDRKHDEKVDCDKFQELVDSGKISKEKIKAATLKAIDEGFPS